MKKSALLPLMVFFMLCVACKNDDASQLEIQDLEKKSIASFQKINEAWKVQLPMASMEVKNVLASWKSWQTFEQEWQQKPSTSLSAFKLEVKNLVNKSDSLHLNVPKQFNTPQVRSRIVAMQTKILDLDTYFSLDIVPHQKINEIILAINKEYMGFYGQCEEIIIKQKIPLEMGEEKLISIKDTTRNAKVVDFNKLEEKEQINEINKK